MAEGSCKLWVAPRKRDSARMVSRTIYRSLGRPLSHLVASHSYSITLLSFPQPHTHAHTITQPQPTPSLCIRISFLFLSEVSSTFNHRTLASVRTYLRDSQDTFTRTDTRSRRGSSYRRRVGSCEFSHLHC